MGKWYLGEVQIKTLQVSGHPSDWLEGQSLSLARSSLWLLFVCLFACLLVCWPLAWPLYLLCSKPFVPSSPNSEKYRIFQYSTGCTRLYDGVFGFLWWWLLAWIPASAQIIITHLLLMIWKFIEFVQICTNYCPPQKRFLKVLVFSLNMQRYWQKHLVGVKVMVDFFEWFSKLKRSSHTLENTVIIIKLIFLWDRKSVV